MNQFTLYPVMSIKLKNTKLAKCEVMLVGSIITRL